MPRGVPAKDEAERRELARARYRRWYEKNREQRRTYSRAYFAANDEAREKRRLRSKAYYAENHDAMVAAEAARRERRSEERTAEIRQRHRDYMLKYKFGLTRDEYNAMLEAQGGVCAICERPERAVARKRGGTRDLAVDHCHKTGRIRALLCQKCNLGLAKFEENPDLFERAVAYLALHTA